MNLQEWELSRKLAVVEHPNATAIPVPEALLTAPKKSKQQPQERALELEKEPSLKVRPFQ